MKKIYYFDKETYEYIGIGQAFKDPLASKEAKHTVYAKPVNSTFIPVPVLKDNERAVYNKVKDDWNVIKSNKGSYKINTLDGSVSLITDNDELKSYECLIPEDLIDDYKENPIKYDVINGELVDISKVQKYRNKYDIRMYKQLIKEAKEAYILFRETPVEYNGKKYLPRYVDDYAALLNRTFPVEIWDYTGTVNTVMSRNELIVLKDYLDDLDKKAYSMKKHAIKKYKKEIEKLGGLDD